MKRLLMGYVYETKDPNCLATIKADIDNYFKKHAISSAVTIKQKVLEINLPLTYPVDDPQYYPWELLIFLAGKAPNTGFGGLDCNITTDLDTIDLEYRNYAKRAGVKRPGHVKQILVDDNGITISIG